jgi:hypothetical protein
LVYWYADFRVPQFTYYVTKYKYNNWNWNKKGIGIGVGVSGVEWNYWAMLKLGLRAHGRVRPCSGWYVLRVE